MRSEICEVSPERMEEESHSWQLLKPVWTGCRKNAEGNDTGLAPVVQDQVT